MAHHALLVTILWDYRAALIVPVIALSIYLFSYFRTIWQQSRPYPNIPLIALDGLSPKESWIRYANETLAKGLQECGDRPFQIMTGTGPYMVLRAHYLEEISKNKACSLSEVMKPDFMIDYRGFEGARYSMDHPDILPAVVRTKLTQSLGIVTEDLVEEASDSIHDIFGESEEWQTFNIKDDTLQMVARLSSRVFLGKPLCRDQNWLDIAKGYTVHVFSVQRDLRKMSLWLRPIQYWFTQSCTEIRNEYREAVRLIRDEVARRDVEAKKYLAAGKKPPKKSDAIAWFVEHTNGTMTVPDLVAAQLGLTIAAIHTTSEATCIALQHLCMYPQYMQPLREEIVTVLRETGWHKTSLYKLKFLDSFLKESQRYNRGLRSIGRAAMEDITLSDGTHIPKGYRIMLVSRLRDPDVYENPYTFDPYRFLKKSEEPGQAGRWSLVSATPEHTAFGLGDHACPGRFFASNEVKIAFCFLLLKYDIDFVPELGYVPPMKVEGTSVTSTKSKLRFRRRKAEIDLGSLEIPTK